MFVVRIHHNIMLLAWFVISCILCIQSLIPHQKMSFFKYSIRTAHNILPLRKSNIDSLPSKYRYQNFLFALNNKAVGTETEDGVSLSSLVDFNEVGIFLGNSIQKWLDDEYIPLNVHKVIGDNVKQTYLFQRIAGVNDLGEMMMDIGTSLETVDMNEAFVNAWDVANKVSDLLMIKLDRELSACSGDLSRFLNDEIDRNFITTSDTIDSNNEDAEKVKILNKKGGVIKNSNDQEDSKSSSSTDLKVSIRISRTTRKGEEDVSVPIPAVKVDAERLVRTALDLKSEFSRYKLLRDFLEGM